MPPVNQHQLRIVVVTRRTRLEELTARFNTQQQAKFYLEHNRLDYGDYQTEHDTYYAAVAEVRRRLDGLRGGEVKVQYLDRGFLPNFIFAGHAAVVAVGQDGLVANTAKYLGGLPLIGVNPDPQRFDGVLLPWKPEEIDVAAEAVLAGSAKFSDITMAEARLNDGQKLLAFNDFLIGRRDHVSARYSITFRGRTETQSSSGVLVSTGAGSTGWISSVRNMAVAVAEMLNPSKGQQKQTAKSSVSQNSQHSESPSESQASKPSTESANWQLPSVKREWSDPRLMFVVREPFASRATSTKIAAGVIEPGHVLKLESRMPEGGVIFSDGLDADGLAFNSGTVAEIRAADLRTRLVRRR